MSSLKDVSGRALLRPSRSGPIMLCPTVSGDAIMSTSERKVDSVRGLGKGRGNEMPARSRIARIIASAREGGEGESVREKGEK